MCVSVVVGYASNVSLCAAKPRSLKIDSRSISSPKTMCFGEATVFIDFDPDQSKIMTARFTHTHTHTHTHTQRGHTTHCYTTNVGKQAIHRPRS